jgi:hypothetical protein
MALGGALGFGLGPWSFVLCASNFDAELFESRLVMQGHKAQRTKPKDQSPKLE